MSGNIQTLASTQIASGGGGGFSVIANIGDGSPNASPITTSAINTTGADLIIVAASNGNAAFPTITDSKSNTWGPRSAYIQGGIRVALSYTVPSSVGSGHTFTAPGYSTLAVLAVSGGNATPFDTDTGGNGTPGASTYQLGAGITPSVNDCIVVTALTAYDDIEPSSINGGFTITYQVGYGTLTGLVFAYLIQTSAAAANPTWTGTGTIDEAAATIASFKPA